MLFLQDGIQRQRTIVLLHIKALYFIMYVSKDYTANAIKLNCVHLKVNLIKFELRLSAARTAAQSSSLGMVGSHRAGFP